MDLLGVLVGRADNGDVAQRICGLFDDCPYNVLNSAREEMVVLLFSIPEDHKWWLERVEKEPDKTLGLSEVEVLFTEHLDAPPREVTRREEPPCGTDCKRCERYLEGCKGCPSVFGDEGQTDHT